MVPVCASMKPPRAVSSKAWARQAVVQTAAPATSNATVAIAIPVASAASPSAPVKAAQTRVR